MVNPPLELIRPTPALLARARYVAEIHLRSLPVHRAIIRVPECLLLGSQHYAGPILDVGCGDGHFASTCLATAVDAGVDLHEGRLGEALRTGVYRLATAASAVHLPFADRSFATVIGNCSLEHVPDFDGAIREIARVLAPRGRFVMTVPSEQFTTHLFWARAFRGAGLRAAAKSYERWFRGISTAFHTCSRDEWIRRLSAAGLRVDSWTSYLGPDAMSFFDLSHYYGAPTLVSKRLTGRWVLWPNKRKYLPWERWLETLLAEFASQIAIEDGAYYFFSATRTA
ncbi:MAG: class I SAM-dependent methyltransferase [Chloroflexota bacterium]